VYRSYNTASRHCQHDTVTDFSSKHDMFLLKFCGCICRPALSHGARAVPAEDERSQALATEAQDPGANAQGPHELQNNGAAVERHGT